MNKNKGIWVVIIAILMIGVTVTVATNSFINDKSNKIELASQTTMGQEGETTLQDQFNEPPAAPAMGRMAAPPASPAAVTGGGAGVSPSEEAAIEDQPDSGDIGAKENASAPALSGYSMPMDSAPGATPETEYSIQTSTADVVISPLAPEGKTRLTTVAEEDAKAYFEKRLNELDNQIQKMREESEDSNTYTIKALTEKEFMLWNSELNAVYEVIVSELNEEDKAALEQSQLNWIKVRDVSAEEAARKFGGGTLESVEYSASLTESTRTRAYSLIEEYVDVLSAKEEQ